MKWLLVSMFSMSVGCGMSHRDQCDALVAKVNAVSDAVTKGGAIGKEDAMADFARTVARAKSELSTLRIAEAQLVGDRDRYLAVLDRIESAAKDLSAAAKKHDDATMRRSFEVIQSSGRDESAAVERINRDCAAR